MYNDRLGYPLFRGFKGMLMVDSTLRGTGLGVRFRASQLKFKEPVQRIETTGNSAVLGLVEHSRPYTTGYLNLQVTL